MANLATITYKVTGTREAVNNLWTTLQNMEVDSKDIWLFKLAEHYGIDYEKKQISVRGHIYWAEYEEEEENDYYLLSFDTETAWDACNELFLEINRILGDELSISYRCCESGCDLFYTHDDGDLFPEECCVSSYVEPFEDACEDVFDTIEDAMLNGHQRPVSDRETVVRKKWWTLSIAMDTRAKRPISTSILSHSNKYNHWGMIKPCAPL